MKQTFAAQVKFSLDFSAAEFAVSIGLIAFWIRKYDAKNERFGTVFYGC